MFLEWMKIQKLIQKVIQKIILKNLFILYEIMKNDWYRDDSLDDFFLNDSFVISSIRFTVT